MMIATIFLIVYNKVRNLGDKKSQKKTENVLDITKNGQVGDRIGDRFIPSRKSILKNV